jgi:hypothetical protein
MSGLQLPSITLGGKNVYDAPIGGRNTNVFTMYTGGCRYGTGRFLMNSQDYNTIQGMATKGTIELNMDGQPGPGISLEVVLAGAVPYMTGPVNQDINILDKEDNSTSNDIGMVEVIVFDQRAQLTNPITGAINVQQDGFPYNGTTPVYYTETINGSSAWSWTDGLGNLQDSMSNTLDPVIPSPVPSWNPRNIIYDNTATNKVIDDIAGQLFLVTGFQDDNYDLTDWYKPGESTGGSSGQDSGNTNTLSQAQNYVIEGNDWVRNPTRFPSKIAVSFKVYNPTDPYKNITALANSGNNSRTYEVDVNQTGSSGSQNFIMPLFYGNYVAIYASGSVTNTSELTTIANDIGARAYKYYTGDMGEQKYAGIWNFVPDGLIRGIQWTSNANGSTTTIRLNDERDFCPAAEPMRAVESISNQLMVGLGASNASSNNSGSRLFWGTSTQVVPVVFGSATATQAIYNGNILIGTTTGGPPGSMTNGQACQICNLPDLNLTGLWPVSSGTYSFGLIVGSTTSGGSTVPVVWTEATPTENCS